MYEQGPKGVTRATDEISIGTLSIKTQWKYEQMNTGDWGAPVPLGNNQTDALGLFALYSRGFQSQTW